MAWQGLCYLAPTTLDPRMDLQEPSNEPQIWRQRRVMEGVDCQMSHSAEAKREQGDNVRGLDAFRPGTWLVISREQVNLSWE
jgi:hypothetical protein